MDSTSTAEKTRETRLRRMADRQGLKLVKSRRRDPRAIGYGCYALTDVQHGGIVAGWNEAFTDQPGWSLDDVECFLTGEAV